MQFNKKRSLLAVAIGTALSSTALPAFSQESEAEANKDVEVIQVKGIRGSLIKSVDVKRTSDGVVDAISAEDIGKFPDTNLAESLQRITGVSIDRTNNEGNQVTVRGFGPEFNVVTLNGRQMPSASTDRNVTSTRAFNFAEIASESVSGVEVYKTSKAYLAGGSIGSTINIQTAKPFDFDETKISFSAKAIHDSTVDSNYGSSVTPEIAGLFSTKFADDKFGILITGSIQERDSREEISATDGWLQNNVDPNGVDFSAVGGDSSRTVWAPQNYNIDISDHERKRINGQVVLQFAPTDTLVATLDYTVSQYEDDIERNQLGVWFNGGGSMTGTVDENGTLANFTQTNSNVDFFGYTDHIETENDSIGLNVEWQASDSLTFTFDVHSSSSEAQPDAENGSPNETFVITGVPQVNGVTMDYSNGLDLPGMQIDSANYPGTVYDQANIGSLFVANNLTAQKTDVDQFKVDGEWLNLDDGALETVKFGLSRTDYKTNTQRWQTQRSTGYYANFPVVSQGQIDTSNWELVPIDGLLSSFSGTESLPPFMYRYDVAAHIAQLETFYDPLRGQTHPAYGDTVTDNYLTTFFPGDIRQDHIIEELTTAAYVQFDVSTEFNDMAVDILAGVRYEQTDVTGSSLLPDYTTLRWDNGNQMSILNSGDNTYTNAESDYDVFLPSLDVSFEVQEDMIVRFSYSKSITRPFLGDMRETFTPNNLKAIGNLDASRGNSALKPFTAQNVDLTWEYYYGEGSYVAVGYFRKIVDNFITNSKEDQTFAGVLDPASGPRAAQAAADLAAAGGDPSNLAALFGQMQANEAAAGRTGPILGDAALGDPLAVFEVTFPSNNETGTFSGWELAAQHLFDDTGFGLQANATFVSSDVEFDVENPDFVFALPGLSDSANFVAFYDKDGIQARIAYNWRDTFLAGVDQLRIANEPTFAESFGQWDANVSYDINENITVFIEGLNLTGESLRQHGRWENQLVKAFEYGPRYAVGVRGSF